MASSQEMAALDAKKASLLKLLGAAQDVYDKAHHGLHNLAARIADDHERKNGRTQPNGYVESTPEYKKAAAERAAAWENLSDLRRRFAALQLEINKQQTIDNRAAKTSAKKDAARNPGGPGFAEAKEKLRQLNAKIQGLSRALAVRGNPELSRLMDKLRREKQLLEKEVNRLSKT